MSGNDMCVRGLCPPESIARISRSSGVESQRRTYTDLQSCPMPISDKQRTVICVRHQKILDLVLYVTHLKVKPQARERETEIVVVLTSLVWF